MTTQSSEATAGGGEDGVVVNSQESQAEAQDRATRREAALKVARGLREATIQGEAARVEKEQAEERGEAVPEAPKAAAATEEPKEGEAPTAGEKKSKLAQFLESKKERGQAQVLREENERLKAEMKANEERIRQEATAQVLAQLKKSAPELLRQHNLPPQELAQQLMDDLTQDPLKMTQRELEEAKARLAAQDAKLEEFIKRQEEMANTTAQERDKQRMIATVADSADKFPFLVAKYAQNPDALAARINQIGWEVFQNTGHKPSYEDVAEHLEEVEYKEHTSITERLKPAAPASSVAAGRKTGRTLSAKMAGRESAVRSAEDLTDEERRANAKQAWRKAQATR